jgi:hypothetical protein
MNDDGQGGLQEQLERGGLKLQCKGPSFNICRKGECLKLHEMAEMLDLMLEAIM